MPFDFLDYDLPPELIAQRPAARREDARLLVVDRATEALHDSSVERIGDWLSAGDALVVNETRVIPARLNVTRPTGGRVELLFVRPAADGAWQVLARPAKSANPGMRLLAGDALELEVVAAGDGGERSVRAVRGVIEDVLRDRGAVPLPPYIDRAPDREDVERYQTVYARVDGAVAAPTAGLHFSEPLLARLAAAGITRVPVVLHVGPGTFRPITAENPRAHVMDEERYEVDAAAVAALEAVHARGGRRVAVGTTVARALESAADVGSGTLIAARGATRKFIVPPYRWQAVDALLTNFHLPRTTLLLLVAALAGEGLLRRAYAHAVRERYRFYSYGDAMLVR